MQHKRHHVRLAVPLAAAIVVAVCSVGALACTSINISPGATVTGFSSVSHANDCGQCSFEIYKVPAKDWEPGAMRDILNLPQYTDGYQRHEVAEQPTGNQIPQVPHTFAHIKGHFGYISENQVAVGETTIGGRPEFRNQDGWFEITNLSMIAMERATSA
jgi:hypothetical protein